MDAKYTPGPLKVVMQSTCSAAWPTVVQTCNDPETGEAWDREIGKADTSHIETAEARESKEISATYDEAPHRFKLDESGEEAIANATLWAAAPDLLEALRKYELPIDINNIALSCIEFGSEAVERELQRRAAIAKATGEPQ